MALHKVLYRGDKEVWHGVSDDDVEKSTENMSDHITDTEQSDLVDDLIALMYILIQIRLI